MRVKEAALRLKRFEVEEKTQRVHDLQHMIGEFEQMAHDLERQIEAEEERTGVRDRAHFAYSTFARSASQRRENLMASVRDLRARLENAVTERDEATVELEQVDAGFHREDERHQREPVKATSADPR
jgi:flagellar protein FliJ